MTKAFVSWSGGKDCCQAAYLAQQQGFDIKYLVNMVTRDAAYSCSHGMASRWIKMQSRALGMSLVQEPTTSENYTPVFINTLKKLNDMGIEFGIFGDIDFEPHRDWIEKACSEAGIQPVLPLWGLDQSEICHHFIDSGFISVVVATKADILGEEWLGRTIDNRFLKEISGLDKKISPCGEAGEYHTLVIDGPSFEKRLDIIESRAVLRGEYWFLDILNCLLKEKNGAVK
jgi:diphthine-ammonia ligase